MAEKGEWAWVAVGFALAFVADLIGFVVGLLFGLYLGEQVAGFLLPTMVLLGQVAAVAILALAVRKRRPLLKGVYIGGAVVLLLASLCVGAVGLMS